MAASLTDEQIERLHIEYGLSGKIAIAARNTGVSWSSAKRYLKDEITDPNSPLAKMREQKRVDLAAELGDAVIVLVRAMKDPAKIGQAELRDVATSLGIAIDKLQLITGQATERHEHRDLDEPRTDLARRIDELAERRRAKHADPRTQAVGS